jgi:hypothetical protein
MNAPADTMGEPPRSPPIPDPRLQMVRNWTPFSHFDCDKMGPGRKFHDTIVVKGTFLLSEGVLERAREQSEVAVADTYWDDGAPERSSLKHAGEVLLVKPTTDVIVTGTARSPGGAPLPALEASVVVRRGGQTVLGHRARVLGPRVFRHGAGGWTLEGPEPTGEVPIRYELSYGGAHPAPEGPATPPWVVHAPNPSGTGFFDEAELDPARTYRAPQWEPEGHPLSGINREIPLAGFGPVARHWSSRLGYAGTYDDAWEREMRADSDRGLPADYARDFDPRFFQCGHPELIAPSYLEGDEEIVLTGVMPAASPFVARLPGVHVFARLVDGKGGRHEERMVLDTVHVDVDAGAVYLCWRLTLDQGRDVHTALITAGDPR